MGTALIHHFLRPSTTLTNTALHCGADSYTMDPPLRRKGFRKRGNRLKWSSGDFDILACNISERKCHTMPTSLYSNCEQLKNISDQVQATLSEPERVHDKQTDNERLVYIVVHNTQPLSKLWAMEDLLRESFSTIE